MLTYTSKYGIYDNPTDNLLSRSRFICVSGSSSYKSLIELEAEGIWFIHKSSWGGSNGWANVWIDNWGAVWAMSGSNHSNGGEPISKVHSGFSNPMPDICIENIVSKVWPLPDPPQTAPISNAVKAYVTMFLDLEKSKIRIEFEVGLVDSMKVDELELQDEIQQLRTALDIATSELKTLKVVESTAPVIIGDLLELQQKGDTLDSLSSFFETKMPV